MPKRICGENRKIFRENKIDGIFAIEREQLSCTALRLALKKGFKVPKIFQ
jgi:hypothetical protein